MPVQRILAARVYETAHSAPNSELWVHDGLVVSQATAQRLVSGGERLIEHDFGSATIMPAFRDGHAHPLFAARESLGLHVTQCKSMDEILEALSAFTAENPATQWVDGAAYERGITAGRESRAAALLDSVVANVPVVLHADDHHTLWVNTEALKAAGLDSPYAVAAAQAEIRHGSIDIDAHGNATGILREWEAMSLVLDRAPKPTLADDFAAFETAQRDLMAAGIVAVVDAWIDRGMAEVYLELTAAGLLKLRTDLAFRFAPETWRADLDYFVSMRDAVVLAGHPLLSANTAKFFADGAFGSATALVSEPYVGDSGHAGTHGQAVWTRDEFAEATRAAKTSGFALHVHAIGDAGVTAALDAIEAAGAPAGSVIAHAELVGDRDLARMVKLGVTANFEPFWAQPNAMMTSCAPHLGGDRINRLYRMRDALKAGVSLSFGSDWPVSSFVPLEGIQVAVTRATLEAPADRWMPEQALTASECVEAYSVAVARQMGDFGAGSLTVGMAADFIVLATDPLACAPSEISKCEILATFVGGQDSLTI